MNFINLGINLDIIKLDLIAKNKLHEKYKYEN